MRTQPPTWGTEENECAAIQAAEEEESRQLWQQEFRRYQSGENPAVSSAMAQMLEKKRKSAEINLGERHSKRRVVEI